MDVFDPNILQRVFLEAILQVGIKKSIGDLGPECPFKVTVINIEHAVRQLKPITKRRKKRSKV